jgi:hypothetical protein
LLAAVRAVAADGNPPLSHGGLKVKGRLMRHTTLRSGP